MDYCTLDAQNVIKKLNSDSHNGLSERAYLSSIKNHGKNILTKKKSKGLFAKVLECLKEPMMIILSISFIIALVANLGKFFRTGDGDFFEILGILCAIILSVSITLVMEGSSQKAFNSLKSLYDKVIVKVIRQGKIIMMNQNSVVVGDIIILESGDKIIADGRLIETTDFSVNESALTGESVSSKKSAEEVYKTTVPLADRKNMVYSGTFVVSGSAKMIVTAVGDNTEIGRLAEEINEEKQVDTPLQQKLAKLGKTITIIGVSSAVLVFLVSICKLIITGNLTYSSVQDLFVSCIILIVAAVPEGLPTIVAVSLALNMIKLSKENALIKKMIATETTGAISVICSDKTGTLTKNKMTVLSVCNGQTCNLFNEKGESVLVQNFILNSTADLIKQGAEYKYKGSATECALIASALKADKKLNYKKMRDNYTVIRRTPFSSAIKYMSTTVLINGVERELIKGAGEKVLPLCALNEYQEKDIVEQMTKEQKMSRRVICFAHKDAGKDGYEFDGFAVLADEIRDDVVSAVNECKTAGIKVKMLTGDNAVTAYSIAKQIGICESEMEVVSASDIENYSDEKLKLILPKISVVARSTPLIKLRIVKLLKEMGEVVAVTGDGINDAPAIKHADVGIAMGISGSEITKEASDIVLLDDSFSTIVKAVSFGRNVFKNLQRFILFQLSINLSALLIIIASALIGFNPPFNTLQLLWINVIMDGPPALTLGLESMNNEVMRSKPVKRGQGIVSKKMLLRIIFNGIFVGTICFLQYAFNILKVQNQEKGGAIFTLFITFQLFNAFNSRELGKESIFKKITSNKVMLITFGLTFLLQILIVTFGYKVFGISPLTIKTWLKILALSFSIVVISELYKLVFRKLKFSRRKIKNSNSLSINKKPIGAQTS